MRTFKSLFLSCFIGFCLSQSVLSQDNIPYLRKQGTATQLIIIFIKTDTDEFLVAGSGAATLRFAPTTEGNFTGGIASIDEQVLVDGKWVWQRRLNGDQNGQGQVLKTWQV